MAMERTLTVGGLRLALNISGDPENPAVIMLHGWQDNAATFGRLAPLLEGYYLVAPDLPGHGLSAHRGAGAEYTIWSYCVEVIGIADALALDSFILVGHSMGGAIASLLSALFPGRISSLVLLDALGPITTGPGDAPGQMRKAIEQRKSLQGRQPWAYPGRDEAVAARAKKGMDMSAARLLGERGIDHNDSGYFWRHDARLTRLNLMRMTEEQVDVFLRRIECPVLLILSARDDGGAGITERRVSLVRNIRVERLGGGHHQHLDGDVKAVGSLITAFLAGTDQA